MPFELRITNAGRAALADGNNRGTQAIRLTKVAIGDGQGPGGAADDGRTALRSQRAAVAAGGSSAVAGRIAVRGEFNPAAAYGVTEVGLLGRVGAEETGAEELYAYWTDGGALIASTVSGTRLLIAASLDIAPAAAQVTVAVSAAVSLGDPALSGAVTALGGRVDTAEADIDALEGAGFGALITALATRVAELEGQDVGIKASKPQQAYFTQSAVMQNVWHTLVDHMGAGWLQEILTLSTGGGGRHVDLAVIIDGAAEATLPFSSVTVDFTPTTPASNTNTSRREVRMLTRFTSRLRVRARMASTIVGSTLNGKVYYSTDI